MKKKQNQTFFQVKFSSLTPYLSLSKKILKYFNNFQNRNFSVFFSVTQTMELKQNQTFFRWTYSNDTKIFQ